MKKDNFKTYVIFRKFPDGGILALFPYDTNSWNRFCGSYMHIGQHSEADYIGCIKSTKPATGEEYQPLFDKLESIGYNLHIIKRRQKK